MTSVAPILLNDGVKGSFVSRVIVALKTKLFFRCHQKRLVVRTVGIVAGITTIVLDDGVKFADLGGIIVALYTQRHALPEKKRLVFR